MAFLVWKEENGVHAWGCADCGLVLRNPKTRESLGEYVAAIRNQFDQHVCESTQKGHSLKLVRKATVQSMTRFAVRMRALF